MFDQTTQNTNVNPSGGLNTVRYHREDAKNHPQIAFDREGAIKAYNEYKIDGKKMHPLEIEKLTEDFFIITFTLLK